MPAAAPLGATARRSGSSRGRGGTRPELLGHLEVEVGQSLSPAAQVQASTIAPITAAARSPSMLPPRPASSPATTFDACRPRSPRCSRWSPRPGAQPSSSSGRPPRHRRRSRCCPSSGLMPAWASVPVKVAVTCLWVGAATITSPIGWRGRARTRRARAGAAVDLLGAAQAVLLGGGEDQLQPERAARPAWRAASSISTVTAAFVVGARGSSRPGCGTARPPRTSTPSWGPCPCGRRTRPTALAGPSTSRSGCPRRRQGGDGGVVLATSTPRSRSSASAVGDRALVARGVGSRRAARTAQACASRRRPRRQAIPTKRPFRHTPGQCWFRTPTVSPAGRRSSMHFIVKSCVSSPAWRSRSVFAFTQAASAAVPAPTSRPPSQRSAPTPASGFTFTVGDGAVPVARGSRRPGPHEASSPRERGRSRFLQPPCRSARRRQRLHARRSASRDRLPQPRSQASERRASTGAACPRTPWRRDRPPPPRQP